MLRAIQRGVRLVWGWDAFRRWLGWTVVANVVFILPLNGISTLAEFPEVYEFLERNLALRGDPIDLFLTVVSAIFVGVGTAYTRS